MICFGKSLAQNQESFYQDKENNPHALNLNKKDGNLKKPLKYTRLGLHKKISEQTTECDSIIEVQDYGLQLKKCYSEQVANDYSEDIFNNISKSYFDTNSCLNCHTISPGLRSRMVDWMIQVLCSYKMSEESFFKSVMMMDSYLKKQKSPQTNKNIHLIGIACMFMATKYEQIYPLRLRHIAEKVARNKFVPQQIVDKESKIIETLGFNLQFATVFDIVKFLFHEIKLNIPRSTDYFYRILVYLSKMCMIDEQVASQDKNLLGSAIFFIGLKTLQQIQAKLVPEQILSQISILVNFHEYQIINVGRTVLNLAKNFSRLYPQFINLKKFNKFTFPTNKSE